MRQTAENRRRHYQWLSEQNEKLVKDNAALREQSEFLHWNCMNELNLILKNGNWVDFQAHMSNLNAEFEALTGERAPQSTPNGETY